MRTLLMLALMAAAAPAFADSLLDLRATFPEVKPYSGQMSPAVTKAFAFPGQGRFRITVTYSPWSRLTNEMFKWRSTTPIDGRDYGAWVEFVPGATPVSSRGDPDPRVDGAGLVVVYEITVRQAQPDMEAAIIPPVVRFGDGSLHQLPTSASVIVESLDNAASADAGRIWTVDEPDVDGGTWHGTWTRRDNSNVYDAYWRHTSGREYRATVEFRGIEGQRITFFRPDVNGSYYGQLGADGRSIQGGTASWYPNGFTWSGSRADE